MTYSEIRKKTLKSIAFSGKLIVWLLAVMTLSIPALAAVTPEPNPNLPPTCGLDVVLVVDRSGSIGASELTLMQDAYKDFIDAMIPRGADIALVTFSRKATVASDFTDDAAVLKNEIDAITTGDSTNWGHALYETGELYRGKDTLVLFGSDGVVNTIGGFDSWEMLLTKPLHVADPNAPASITTDVTGDGVIDEADALEILDVNNDGSRNGGDALDVAIEQANELKRKGIKIMSLAIGLDSSDVSSMEMIADEDDTIATDFSELGDTLGTLYDTFCNRVSVNLSVDGESDPAPYAPPANYDVEWETRLARMCVAGGDWSGVKVGNELNGLQLYADINPGRYSYSLTCGGSIQALDVSRQVNCVLLEGAIQCWGTRLIGGNLGYLPTQPYEVPIAVAVGASHRCVLRGDGEVYCKGTAWANYENDAGGITKNGAASSNYTGGDAVGVDAGVLHTCALLANGDVRCWGFNSDGQSEGYSGKDATSVSTGDFHSCVLKGDGNLNCWGRDTDGSVSNANAYSGSDITQVSAGGVHTCILKNNNNVECFGPPRGPAGERMTDPYTGGDAVQVATGNDFRCILKDDGNVLCDAGQNDAGQREGYNAGDALFVAAGREHACVLTASGNVECWGNPDDLATLGYNNGDAGRLGFDTVVVRVTPFDCGNGVVDIGEDCDPPDMGQFTQCRDLLGSEYVGDLECNNNCEYDVSKCIKITPEDPVRPPGTIGEYCVDGRPKGDTECSDCIDNDGDKHIDNQDPGCWIDPSDSGSYDRDDDSEDNCGDGLCQERTGENPLTCPADCKTYPPEEF